ncbi:OsmC family protein [Flavobacterium granuli]|uniref:Redox protein n=1 Tax=Flavobacterium granuli TaxID=280093 RepID=A0A1M5S2M7_9FLAO|nr:OsmC family protein [Flavobacterium granuli]PRZ21182.1 putative redox protein [Flavobacterium granuli]SHH32548.1 putative redox protein [Flavobacterium granuli]
MIKVTANNGKENYLIGIQTPTGNSVMADEPKEKGGQDKGFSPKELLVSALAACTNATVRMYCDRKGWNLKNVQIEIELIEEDGKTIFKRKLQFEGNLDEGQRQRLFNVANVCPVHKILTHDITVDTALL